MTDELKPVRCGCGGEAKVAFCQQSYCGQNCFGDKKIKYRVYMICKKCHTRGKPIITDWLINPHPWDSKYSGRIRHNAEQDEMFAPYVERAITAWNMAMSGNAQECAKDARCTERTAKVIEHDASVTDTYGYKYHRSEYLCGACKKKVIGGDDYCSHCWMKLDWRGDESC